MTTFGLKLMAELRSSRELVRHAEPDATWTEVACAWAPDAASGLRLAHERFRFGVPGWKVMSELPNPVNFDAGFGRIAHRSRGR